MDRRVRPSIRRVFQCATRIASQNHHDLDDATRSSRALENPADARPHPPVRGSHSWSDKTA
jgi:hypothetical protein